MLQRRTAGTFTDPLRDGKGLPGYSSIDDNVAPCELQSIEDIIENVNNTQNEALNDSDEDDDESSPVLSNAQALSADNDLRRSIDCPVVGESLVEY
ncbi:unnamed protein product [Leptosia nina]|uniref:Uncharacterized protein n=1 Tax=Leptosia nina TaxID=320188 RepID=A0AAV1J7P4_9NEOP